MAWVAIDANGQEAIFEFEPERKQDLFWVEYIGDFLYLPRGSIKKLIGRDLTWGDKPVELKEDE